MSALGKWLHANFARSGTTLLVKKFLKLSLLASNHSFVPLVKTLDCIIILYACLCLSIMNKIHNLQIGFQSVDFQIALLNL